MAVTMIEKMAAAIVIGAVRGLRQSSVPTNPLITQIVPRLETPVRHPSVAASQAMAHIWTETGMVSGASKIEVSNRNVA